MQLIHIKENPAFSRIRACFVSQHLFQVFNESVHRKNPVLEARPRCENARKSSGFQNSSSKILRISIAAIGSTVLISKINSRSLLEDIKIQ